MSLAAGTKLGPYEILGTIGAGGMGEVYRARDPRLKREIALKVSQERFSERFAREARVIAALNHPNICTLHDVGPNYLVMELIEGEPPKGPLPFEEALRIARQIADALDAAHQKGIVHRDLKPANLKVKSDGTVKVLDFGLARAPEGSAGDPENSPTVTASPTREGMILGTAAYMSPEQARGKPVDKRADIWAFGVVFFEMLTGERPFRGETVTDVLACVVKEQPDWSRLPARARPLIRQCLEKDPNRRLRDIGDAALLLSETLQLQPPRRSWIWPAAAGMLLSLVGTIAFVRIREAPLEPVVLSATLLPPADASLDFTDGLGLPALSPDGRHIVFGARTATGKTPLWVRSMDALAAQPLAGTDDAYFPFWSPDGRYIGFFADGKLKRIDAAGGPAISLADAPRARGGSWSPEGVIVFSPSNTSGLVRVSASGGAVAAIEGAAGRFPWFLPDGHHFLYQGQRPASGGAAVMLAAFNDGAGKQLLTAGTNAIYARGHLLFLKDGTLMAQPFDARTLRLSGEAVPVAERVQAVLNTLTAGVFSASDTGMLIYRHGAGGDTSILTWFDRDGRRGASIGTPADFRFSFRLSPDGNALAASIHDAGNRDLWIYDMSRGLRNRFTFDSALDGEPIWSPDGRTIAFDSDRKGHFDLYRKSADGTGAAAGELIYADNAAKYPTSWSPDGKFLLYDSRGTQTNSDIWALPLTPEQPGDRRKPFPVVQTPLNESEGQFSPDGRWVAYLAIDQAPQIYVTPFPPGSQAKQQIANDASAPATLRWRRDGKEIFYVGRDRRMMAAEISVKNGKLEVGKVRVLFGPIDWTSSVSRFEVSPDGQRFLFAAVTQSTAAQPLTLVANWTTSLKR